MKYPVNTAAQTASGAAKSMAQKAAFKVPKVSGAKLYLGSKVSSAAEDCHTSAGSG